MWSIPGRVAPFGTPEVMIFVCANAASNAVAAARFEPLALVDSGRRLQSGLVTEALIGRGKHALRALPLGSFGQALNCRDTDAGQRLDLRLAQPSHLAQVIVSLSTLLTAVVPRTDAAVTHRIGIGLGCPAARPLGSVAARSRVRARR